MSDRRTLDRDRVLVIVLAIVTAVVLIGCIVILAPFLPALTWAVSLVVVAYPLHRRVRKRITNPNVASVISVAAVAAGLIAPTVFVGFHVTRQVAEGASDFERQIQSGKLEQAVERFPKAREVSHWVREHVDMRQESERMLSATRQWVAHTLRDTVWSVAQVLIALFCLFYFFRDCGIGLAFVRSMVPLSDRETDEVLDQVTDMIYATIFGNVVDALIQGGLGGLMFWILGIPAPLLWGVVMALLSLVPSLGAFVIWLPATVIMAMQGHWVKAMILGGWGTFVVSTIDNIVYPILVGQRMRMHTLPVFLSTVGGLIIFGAPGIVLGPVAFTLALALMDVWRRRTGARKAQA